VIWQPAVPMAGRLSAAAATDNQLTDQTIG
jgi:hypothetical protein